MCILTAGQQLSSFRRHGSGKNAAKLRVSIQTIARDTTSNRIRHTPVILPKQNTVTQYDYWREDGAYSLKNAVTSILVPV